MMSANREQEHASQKKPQTTPDPRACILIGERSREREERKETITGHFLYAKHCGEERQMCESVRRALCNGGTDLYYLT